MARFKNYKIQIKYLNPDDGEDNVFVVKTDRLRWTMEQYQRNRPPLKYKVLARHNAYKNEKNNNDLVNIFMWIALIYFTFFGSLSTFGQSPRIYNGELYNVIYSEEYEQPLEVNYKIMCPTGEISRSGMDFGNQRWKTSDNDDYKANVYDKGHMAPAAAFNCFDKETPEKHLII